MSKSSIIKPLGFKPSSVSWKPHPYQEKAMKFMLENPAAGLLLDPGLGKTSITLGTLSILKAQGLMRRTLIVCPLRVAHQVWPLEVQKWTEFADLRVVVLHGSKKEALLAVDADIYVINPEGMAWLAGHFRKMQFDTLVVDESTLYKRTTTQRFKILRPLLGKFERRYILTGTPAPNGVMDLFGQIYVMDMGRSLGSFITHYRNEYFVPAGFGGYEWKLKPGAEDRIYKAIEPYCLRLEAADYLHLPQLINNVISVELPPAARKIYDEMEENMVVDMTGGEQLVAVTAASASIKCRQVANGGVYKTEDVMLDEPKIPGPRQWHKIHDEKTEAVLELVESLQGSPVLIVYEFQHDLERLKKALGPNTPHIGGGVSPAETLSICQRWNRGEIPCLLGHPAAMGHGLNLQESGNHVIIHSMFWDYEKYDQVIKRVLRQGNKSKHVTVHHIVAKDTVDEVIMRGLLTKGKNQKKLLDALKTYCQERAR